MVISSRDISNYLHKKDNRQHGLHAIWADGIDLAFGLYSTSVSNEHRALSPNGLKPFSLCASVRNHNLTRQTAKQTDFLTNFVFGKYKMTKWKTLSRQI